MRADEGESRPEILLIEVDGYVGDYVISERPVTGAKWGVSLPGPSEILMGRMGLASMARMAVLDRGSMRRIHEEALDLVLRSIRALDPVPNFVLITDDCATYSGPLMPRWYMEELYLTSHAVIAEEVRARGSSPFLHADGNYGPLFRELGRTWDLLHPLDVHPRGDPDDYATWMRVVRKIRPQIESRIATGLALELGDEDLVVRAAMEFLGMGLQGVVLSNFHPPLTRLDMGSILGRLGLVSWREEGGRRGRGTEG